MSHTPQYTALKDQGIPNTPIIAPYPHRYHHPYPSYWSLPLGLRAAAQAYPTVRQSVRAMI